MKPGALLFGYAPESASMPAPKFNTPDGPPKCPACDRPIRYQERARHEGVWKHQGCVGIGTLPHILATVAEIGFGGDKEAEAHCVAILSCMNTDTFEQAAELSKLELEFIERVMQPLIDQGVYKDGIWYFDSGTDLDDGQHCTIQILLWTMCSQGLVQRVKAE